MITTYKQPNINISDNIEKIDQKIEQLINNFNTTRTVESQLALANGYHEAAHIYNEMEDYGSAVEYHTRALMQKVHILQELNHSSYYREFLNEYSITIERFELSINEALGTFIRAPEKKDTIILIANNSNDLGLVYEKIGFYMASDKCLETAEYCYGEHIDQKEIITKVGNMLSIIKTHAEEEIQRLIDALNYSDNQMETTEEQIITIGCDSPLDAYDNIS